MRTLLVLVVVAVTSGCLTEGMECSPVGAAVCEDAETSLWCEGRNAPKFTKYRCPGPQGCVTANGTTRCDFTGSAEGTPCPTAADGIAYCATGTRLIYCDVGTWKGMSCSTCTRTGDRSVCEP